MGIRTPSAQLGRLADHLDLTRVTEWLAWEGSNLRPGD